MKRRRVRRLEQRFESRILPLFARRTEHVGALLPQLYLHGLAQGDSERVLRGLLGEGAPLSASSIARLQAKGQPDFGKWKSQPWMGSRWCTPEPTGCTGKRGCRTPRRRCS